MNEGIEFCDFECDKIVSAFEKVFTISNRQELIDAYCVFKTNYYSPEEPTAVVSVDKHKILLKPYENLYVENYWMGIDIPTLFSPYGVTWNRNHPKTIMIVAEDPLRPQNDKKLIPHKDKIILSTPFGLHLKKYRVLSNFYWGFIQKAIGNNYAVYATDIKKIWIKGDKSKETFEPGTFDKCLLAEIEIINPSLIVGFGKFAEDAIQRIKLGLRKEGKEICWQDKVFPHPSWINYKSWQGVLSSQKCNVDNKLTYVVNSLNLDRSEFQNA